jgi:hypothetical protein
VQADLQARLGRDYRLYSSRPGFWRTLAFLARQAEGAPRVAVIGTSNELSDNLVRWWLAMDGRTRDVAVVESLPRRRPPRPWLDRERPARVLAIRLLPSSRFYKTGDFQLYNAWQLAAIAALEKDPAWRVTRRRKFDGLEVEVVVLEPVADRDVLPARPQRETASPEKPIELLSLPPPARSPSLHRP